jgi:hypothetical protein
VKLVKQGKVPRPRPCRQCLRAILLLPLAYPHLPTYLPTYLPTRLTSSWGEKHPPAVETHTTYQATYPRLAWPSSISVTYYLPTTYQPSPLAPTAEQHPHTPFRCTVYISRARQPHLLRYGTARSSKQAGRLLRPSRHLALALPVSSRRSSELPWYAADVCRLGWAGWRAVPGRCAGCVWEGDGLRGWWWLVDFLVVWLIVWLMVWWRGCLVCCCDAGVEWRVGRGLVGGRWDVDIVGCWE